MTHQSPVYAPAMADQAPGEWLAAAASGDHQGWERLVDRYDSLLWSIARSFRLGQADASDVVQTTWLRLLEHLDRIREPDRVGAWLATTARNECLVLLRRRTRQGVPIDIPDELVATIPPLDQPLLDGERDAELWQALHRLSDLCRSLLRLLASDPAPSYQDVALALDMPIGSVGPRRSRCLEQLRHQLSEAATGQSR
jgi:RNA polymerase sigma factor (sigma-70 family)